MSLPENVLEFLQRASDLHGKRCAENFNQDMYCQILDRPIESPIEQLFFIAANALAESENERLNPDPYYNNKGVEILGPGLYMNYQHQIGKYRVEFVFAVRRGGKAEEFPSVVVELDGHDFHDKNKQQRSYEKARDRHLVKAGYKVVHYTGSDVVKDPFKVAFEVFELAGVFHGSGLDIDDFDSNDPLGTSS
jgi:very-short-patch-repair endonuclease